MLINFDKLGSAGLLEFSSEEMGRSVGLTGVTWEEMGAFSIVTRTVDSPGSSA